MLQPSLFAPQTLTVSDLTRYLRALLESDPVLQDVWVMGEVSNLSRPGSGHIYFTLKDDRSALRCVIWRTAAQRMGHLLQNGLAVEAHGEISLYERDGNYQLYIDALRPAGEGALYREFLRLKARLEAEGLFDAERKRSLPDRPTRIGIVTSPTGAALQDMLNTIRRRWVLADVLVSPCAVQGAEAPGEIVAALNRLALLPEPPHVILIARGGGSLEDLWAFNDEQVVRAIANSPIPTITGIGHETDFTLADFAADQRAPTPTGAAEMATPDSAGERQALMQADRWLTDAYLQAVQSLRASWLALQNRLDRLNPRAGIRNEQQRVDGLAERLRLAASHGMELRHSRLVGLASRLEALNPLAILERGYAVVTTEAGQVVRRPVDVQAGQPLVVQVADGKFGVQVTDPSPADLQGKE